VSERERTDSQEAAEGERPRAPAPAVGAAGLVLQLQRGHGNAAVGRMIAASNVLARDPVDAGVPPVAGVPRPDHIDVQPPRPGDVDDMDRAIREHFSNEDWAEAARVLNGFNQTDIDTRIRGYRVDQRAALAGAAGVNGAAAGRIRRPAQFENALFFSQWADAAEAIDFYAEADRVQPRLEACTDRELAALLMHADRANRPVASTMRTVAQTRGAAMTGGFNGAVTGGDWDGAVMFLNALQDAELNALLASPPRTPPQLFDIDRRAVYWGIERIHSVLSVQPVAGVIATEGLDRDLRAQIAGREWGRVTSTLEHYNDDTERRARLQWFHLDEVTALAESIRGGPVGVPSSTIYPLVEARRIEKLGQDYAAAISSSNWIVVVWLLNSYNDTDLPGKATDIQTAKGAAGIASAAGIAQALYPDDNHRVRRILAYVPLQGQTGAAAPGTSTTMTQGAATPGTAVGSGQVVAYQNAAMGAQTGFFGQEYQGADAAQVNWIQFIAREGEKFDAAGRSLGFRDDKWTPTGQTQERQYSSPSDQRWFVDTVGGAAPFYDSPTTVAVGSTPAGAAGVHQNTATTTGMYDAPGLHTDVASSAFNEWQLPWEEDIDHVVMRAKFVQYLVKGNQVLAETSMTVSWTMASASSTPAPVNTAGPTTPTNRMRNVHFRALLTRFPQWNFYNHE
jgi:hypothetical protein